MYCYRSTCILFSYQWKVRFEARVIFRWLSVDSLSAASVRTFVSSLHVRMLCPSVAFGCSVSTCTMKRQQTMLSFLSSNKRSRRVAGKLYNNFRDKQNKAYVLAMKKQPIARNNCLVVDRSTFALPTTSANTWRQSNSSPWNSTWNVFQTTI